ncbi:MAG: transposase [Rickettsia hoogstraalii]
MIKFKHPNSQHCILSLMGKFIIIFAFNVGLYTKTAPHKRIAFASAKSILDEASKRLLAA